jgi:hypothetical protein
MRDHSIGYSDSLSILYVVDKTKRINTDGVAIFYAIYNTSV